MTQSIPNYQIQYLLGILASALVSCTQTSHLATRLDGRGIVVLSPDNPYVASNLLLSQETETQNELRGFIQLRGAPPAIEVKNGSFGALTFNLYYPDRKEFFVAEKEGISWIINGPAPIGKKQLKTLLKLTEHYQQKPVLLNLAYDTAQSSAAIQTSVTTPVPTTAPVVPPTSENIVTTTGEPPFKSLIATGTPNQIASTESSTSAIEQLVHQSSSPDEGEISPKGDIVHYVSLPGETLSIIARWFTLDRSNAGRLARINKLNNPNQLQVGDTIVIPSYLLKNRKRLTEEDIKNLSTIALKEKDPGSR